MDLDEMGIDAGNWVDSAQYRDYWRALVNAASNLRVPEAIELVNIYLPTSWTLYFLKNCYKAITPVYPFGGGVLESREVFPARYLNFVICIEKRAGIILIV